MRIGVLTSGGDSPGMNAAIRALVKAGTALGHVPIGIRDGYEGLLRGDAEVLTLQQVDGISRHGGTMLGSARCLRFATPEGQDEAVARIRALGLDGLVVIGGNGSLTGAHVLSERLPDAAPCRVVGLPASIDNDIGHSALSIGVDTAVNTIVEACDRISDTASAHRRAFVVEVMGRNCGFLAMRAGIAADADAILYAEGGADRDATLDRLRELMVRSFAPGRGKRRVLIVKAEGVPITTASIVAELKAVVPGVDVRETILGHVVRGGSPSAMDRIVAQRLAMGALVALEDGGHDEMLAWEASREVGTATRDPSVRRVPLGEVLAETGRLLDGTSAVTRARVALLGVAERLLAL